MKRLNPKILTSFFFVFSSLYFLLSSEFGAWGNFGLFDSYEEIIQKGGYGDEAGFLRQAQRWSLEGIHFENSRILGLWPPVIMIYHYVFISILSRYIFLFLC